MNTLYLIELHAPVQLFRGISFRKSCVYAFFPNFSFLLLLMICIKLLLEGNGYSLDAENRPKGKQNPKASQEKCWAR